MDVDGDGDGDWGWKRERKRDVTGLGLVGVVGRLGGFFGWSGFIKRRYFSGHSLLLLCALHQWLFVQVPNISCFQVFVSALRLTHLVCH